MCKEGLLTVIIPYEFDIFLYYTHQGCCHRDEVRDVASVIWRQPKKGLTSCMVWGVCQPCTVAVFMGSTSTPSPKERHLIAHEATLRRFWLQVRLCDLLRYCFKSVQCITEFSTINNHIIQEHQANLPIEPRENKLHESLERCRCIAQVKKAFNLPQNGIAHDVRQTQSCQCPLGPSLLASAPNINPGCWSTESPVVHPMFCLSTVTDRRPYIHAKPG